MAQYEIEQLGQDSFEVRDNGTPIFYDAFSLDEAEDEVRRAGGSSYLFIHEDGFEEERDI